MGIWKRDISVFFWEVREGFQWEVGFEMGLFIRRDLDRQRGMEMWRGRKHLVIL